MEPKLGQKGHAQPSCEGGEALGMMRDVQPGMQKPEAHTWTEAVGLKQS